MMTKGPTIAKALQWRLEDEGEAPAEEEGVEGGEQDDDNGQVIVCIPMAIQSADIEVRDQDQSKVNDHSKKKRGIRIKDIDQVMGNTQDMDLSSGVARTRILPTLKSTLEGQAAIVSRNSWVPRLCHSWVACKIS